MGFLKKLFKKKVERLDPINFEVFHTDVHSHLIPGIDDGAQNIDQSIELIESLIGLGYKKIITTPHIYMDYYQNTPEIILEGLNAVQIELKKRNINIQIEAAAEYFLDDHFLKEIEKENLLTFGDNYVLFELPFLTETPYLADAIFQMQLKGYKPVLAHVERYNYWHQSHEELHKIKDKGVLFQLNINSLSGAYGPGCKETAQYMIEKNMYNLVGSDCHHLKHIELLKQASQEKALHDLVAQGDLINSAL